MNALRAGVSLETVRRPIPQTRVERVPSKEEIPSFIREEAKEDSISK